MTSRVGRLLRGAGGVVVRAVWLAAMVLIPLVGFWLASSLAAYSNASTRVALGIGLLLFPVVPVAWDLLFVWRRARRGTTTPPILTRLDRLVLRTLLVNGAFLGVMVWRAPDTALRALAVRGDWMLDGHDGPIAAELRDRLLGTADRFERLWRARSTENGTSTRPPPVVVEAPTGGAPTPTPVPAGGTPAPVPPSGPPPLWPQPEAPDPRVTGVPAAVETSPAAVGQYLAAQITEPRALAKALHDYVVLRMTYDRATFELRGEERRTRRPSQAANDVFAARIAVCEGYARLYVALAEAAGLEVAYVTGAIRSRERTFDDGATDEAIAEVLEGYGHAWNAVKLEGAWRLVDTTWDDPSGATPTLRSTYLFTPPALFRQDHLPDEAAWQLTASPIGVGEFARQPLMTPYAGQLGLSLVTPQRSQITVDDGAVTLVLDNPAGAEMLATIGAPGSPGADCEVDAGPRVTIRCVAPAGKLEVKLFGLPAGAPGTRYPYVGALLVNSR